MENEAATVLRASLRGVVEQSHGKWAAGDLQPTIGATIYELSTPGLELCLGTAGLRLAYARGEFRWPYETLSIVVPSLKDLLLVTQHGVGTLRLIENSIEHGFDLSAPAYFAVLNVLYKFVRLAS